jgi:hypothetical protein
VVLGEQHHATEAGRAANPRWLSIPERGLYTGMAIIGAVGTGKTSACMYPYVDQLLGFKPGDADAKVLLSTTGRSSENDRRSPLTENDRAGKVTLRPPPFFFSHTAKPINFSPSSGPLEKCSSASASFPGGFPFSFDTILTVMASLRRGEGQAARHAGETLAVFVNCTVESVLRRRRGEAPAGAAWKWQPPLTARMDRV